MERGKEGVGAEKWCALSRDAPEWITNYVRWIAVFFKALVTKKPIRMPEFAVREHPANSALSVECGLI